MPNGDLFSYIVKHKKYNDSLPLG